MRAALVRPVGGRVENWLASIAHFLLNRVRLIAGREAHRLIEVEAYYHSEDHPDAFAHRDPIQVEQGRWYFHKSHGVYRSGSFKGLDLTFGDGTAHGGILFRGLEIAGGEVVDGPSLLVDHLLARCGKRDIHSLDLAIDSRSAWEADCPLRLEEIGDEGRPVHTSARVGLSLKRLKPTGENVGFLLKRYRYLSEPRATAKGKVQLVLALHCEGRSAHEIRDLTGCPLGAIQRHVAEYEAGTKESDLLVYGGIDLGPRELCRLHGMGAVRIM